MQLIKDLLKKQVVKFILLGAFCSVIEFLTFSLLIGTVKMDYLLANVISVVFAISINYVISREFVFEKSKYSKRDEILFFVLFSVLAILLNQFILWLFVEFTKIDIRLCKAIAIFIVASFNYLTKKHIVFKA